MIDDLPFVVEGDVDLAVMRKLLAFADLPFSGGTVANGKQKLKKFASAWNKAARNGGPRLILCDLDAEPCPSGLITQFVGQRNVNLCFRVAVREIEAWLLADAKGIARFFDISPSVVPPKPENLPKPKESMIDLARRSNILKFSESMAPRPGSGRSQGPAYSKYIIDFVTDYWSPAHAIDSKRAPSLNRAFRRLTNFRGTGYWR